ncbi:hypothetical protein GF336_04660 [Candidatus Woesearchaeota archaeon]|nr:hypothetical protein [Candidatus Woesearchaeota archaeon]
MINIPKNSASIIVSPPLEGKKELMFQLIRRALQDKEPVIFLLTDTSPEEIKKELLKSKIYYGAKKGLLNFIDCYSQQAGNDVSDTKDTRRISGPLAFNEISIALAQLEKDLFNTSKSHTIIFDSLSTILMYSNPQMAGRFLQILIAKIKNAGGSVLFTLEEGMHNKKDMITIEHLMQAIIHLKQKNNKIMIKAEGIKDMEGWKEFKNQKP